MDRIRDLGWPGVMGNTDELLIRSDALDAFAAPHTGLEHLFAVVGEMAAWTRDALGEERLAWLAELPASQPHETMTLVHASPGDAWTAPSPEAEDADLDATYGPLARPVVAYGHIHLPYVRRTPAGVVANSGSVGLPFDGDPRTSYLLVDGRDAEIRRVAYDVDREIRALASARLPYSDWTARMLASARSLMP